MSRLTSSSQANRFLHRDRSLACCCYTRTYYRPARTLSFWRYTLIFALLLILLLVFFAVGIVPTGHDLEAGNGKRAGHVLSNAARAQPDEYDFSMPVAITGARNFEQNLSRPSHQSNAATGRSSSGNSGSVARDRSSPPPPFEEAMGSKCK